MPILPLTSLRNNRDQQAPRPSFRPQFWIKKFVSADGKLWGYEWYDDQVKHRSSKAVMQIFDLYTIQPSGADDTSLESNELGTIDTQGAITFDRVLNGDRSEAVKADLASFLAVQIMRDPDTLSSYRPRTQELTLQLLNALTAKDYASFSADFEKLFPGADIKEAEYNHIRGLGPGRRRAGDQHHHHRSRCQRRSTRTSIHGPYSLLQRPRHNPSGAPLARLGDQDRRERRLHPWRCSRPVREGRLPIRPQNAAVQNDRSLPHPGCQAILRHPHQLRRSRSKSKRSTMKVRPARAAGSLAIKLGWKTPKTRSRPASFRTSDPASARLSVK